MRMGCRNAVEFSENTVSVSFLMPPYTERTKGMRLSSDSPQPSARRPMKFAARAPVSKINSNDNRMPMPGIAGRQSVGTRMRLVSSTPASTRTTRNVAPSGNQTSRPAMNQRLNNDCSRILNMGLEGFRLQDVPVSRTSAEWPASPGRLSRRRLRVRARPAALPQAHRVWTRVFRAPCPQNRRWTARRCRPPDCVACPCRT